MAETPSTASSGFDGEALRQKICEEMKTHRGSPEALTRAVAKIIIREGLGLADKQMADEYQCFRGLADAKMGRADLAVTYEDIDLNTRKKNPKILLELKRRDRRFIFGSKNYFEDVDQLKGYMNSKSCRTIEHGMIFNIDQLQIFRKHGNLIFFITKIIDFPDFNDQTQRTVESIENIIDFMKTEVIEQPRESQRLPGTIITLWNNKGGVGKTTTTAYLSLLLSLKNCPRKRGKTNKVIVIDFDHNQANLTKRFKCEKTNGKTQRLLDYIRIHKNLDYFNLKGYFEEIKSEKERTEIHFLPADQDLCVKDLEYENTFYIDKDGFLENYLRELCLELAKKNYDYIIIDTPPGWDQNIYARSAVAAADCLLPIGGYGDFDSFHGYYSVVCNQLPGIRQMRSDMGPDNLGLWINNWRSGDRSQIGIREMNSEEFEFYIRKTQQEKQEELRRSFFNKDNKLRKINYSALIAKSSCYNPDMKVDFLETFNHAHIRNAYSDLLKSIIGEE